MVSFFTKSSASRKCHFFSHFHIFSNWFSEFFVFSPSSYFLAIFFFFWYGGLSSAPDFHLFMFHFLFEAKQRDFFPGFFAQRSDSGAFPLLCQLPSAQQGSYSFYLLPFFFLSLYLDLIIFPLMDKMVQILFLIFLFSFPSFFTFFFFLPHPSTGTTW